MSLQEQQKHLLVACSLTALIVSGLMYTFVVPSGHKSTGIVHEKMDVAAIKTPGSTVQSNELWMQKINQESELQSKKLALLENVFHKQLGQGGETPPNGETAQKFTQLEQAITALKKQIDDQGKKEEDDDTVAAKQTPPRAPLVKYDLQLQGGLHTVKDHIPPGTYVKAVLLSAVDVGVGVNVSADPQPALLRLLGEGHLPNNATSHLKRCHIVGAAVGDLSSERAFIRLEKMSCVDTKTNRIVETDVAGYVTGEDGKNGLAGVVVDHSGRMISSAVLVGLISGIGGAVQGFAAAKSNDTLLSKLGDRGVQNNVLSSEFLKGGGQHTAGAFEKLADYYIKRAEQLQPIIQINAGRVVHIVFTKGAHLGTETLVPLSPPVPTTAPSKGERP